MRHKSIATGLRKHCSLGIPRGQKNTCAIVDAVQTWAKVTELNKSYFFICVCVCVCHWLCMNVCITELDDRDWVIQGRVCALWECLLFHSHVDLGCLMKSARLPELLWAAAALIPHNSKALDHCSHKPLNDRIQENKVGLHVPFSIHYKQVGCADAYVRHQM